MKTKALLGAIVVAVLAVMGIVGLQQPKSTEAGNILGISGCSATIVLQGQSCDFTITFQDDQTLSAINASVDAGSLGSVSTTCTAATIQGTSTFSITLFDAGNSTAANPGPGCDTDAIQQIYTWTLRFTCPAVTTARNILFTISAPATGAGSQPGSLSPGLPGNQTGTPGTFNFEVQCVPQLTAGNNGSTVTIRKIDQFGQPMASTFQILASPFFVPVAVVNLGSTIAQNPCATDGTQGSFNIPGAGGTCSAVGVITGGPGIAGVPAGCTLAPTNTCAGTFPSGLPAGQYRVVETGLSRSANCTLVQVYNGNQAANQSNLLPFSGDMLFPAANIQIPSANILDLQLTFVNSCQLPGAPSTATSQIAVVIGGSTPGLVNTSNIEIYPAPGSDDDARLDIRVRDANNVPIANAHVTVLIDKGTLAVRRDLSTFPNAGYDVIEPTPAASFASPFSGDTCDQAITGFLTQSTSTGNFTFPYLTNSRQIQDGYTNVDGILSACVYVDPVLAPGTTPGRINVQAIVETTGQGGIFNPGLGSNPFFPLGNTLALPNFLAAPNIVLTATITVVGPPASITVSAAPTTLNCGEKATITATVKDSAGQNVSDRTRVELVTNFGGVIGGTAATLGPVGITGGQVYPISSSSAETFNGVATAYLLTSTDHVGPYEVVAAAGGSTMASNGFLAPFYNPVIAGQPAVTALTPAFASYFPVYNQGLLTYNPSSAPVNAQATVTCTVPGAPAPAAPVFPAPPVVAPRTGDGFSESFAIRPPNTGDAGMAATSGSSSWTLIAGALMVITISGAAVVTVTRR